MEKEKSFLDDMPDYKTVISEKLKAEKMAQEQMQQQAIIDLQSMTAKQIRIQELDMFEFENKVRMMVSQLVEPLTKTSMGQQAQLNELLEQIKKNEYAIDNIQKTISLINKRFATAFDLQRRQITFENEIFEFKAVFRNEIQSMNDKMQSFDQKVELNKAQITSIHAIEGQLQQTSLAVEQMMENYKTDIAGKFRQCTEEVIQKLQGMQYKNKVIQNTQKQQENSIDNIKAFVQGLDIGVQKQVMEFAELKAVLDEQMFQHTLNDKIKELQKNFTQEIECIKIDILDAKKGLKETDNYIEKYFPIKYFSEFSRNLYNVIQDPESKNNVINLSIQKFKELEEIVNKDSGWPSYNKKYYEIPTEQELKSMLIEVVQKELEPIKNKKSYSKRPLQIRKASYEKKLTLNMKSGSKYDSLINEFNLDGKSVSIHNRTDADRLSIAEGNNVQRKNTNTNINNTDTKLANFFNQQKLDYIKEQQNKVGAFDGSVQQIEIRQYQLDGGSFDTQMLKSQASHYKDVQQLNDSSLIDEQININIKREQNNNSKQNNTTKPGQQQMLIEEFKSVTSQDFTNHLNQSQHPKPITINPYHNTATTNIKQLLQKDDFLKSQSDMPAFQSERKTINERDTFHQEELEQFNLHIHSSTGVYQQQDHLHNYLNNHNALMDSNGVAKQGGATSTINNMDNVHHIHKQIELYMNENFEPMYRQLRDEDRSGEIEEIVEIIDERIEYAKQAIEQYVNTYFTTTMEKLEQVLNEHTIQIKQNRQQMLDIDLSIRDYILKEMEKVNLHIKHSQETRDDKFKELEFKFDNYQRKNTRQQSDFEIKIEKFKGEVQKIEQFKESNKNVIYILSLLVELEFMQQALDDQNELVKNIQQQKPTLRQQNDKNQHNKLMINKQSGSNYTNNNQLTSIQFGQVYYHSKCYSRQQFISIKKLLLETEWNNYVDKPPFIQIAPQFQNINFLEKTISRIIHLIDPAYSSDEITINDINNRIHEEPILPHIRVSSDQKLKSSQDKLTYQRHNQQQNKQFLNQSLDGGVSASALDMVNENNNSTNRSFQHIIISPQMNNTKGNGNNRPTIFSRNDIKKMDDLLKQQQALAQLPQSQTQSRNKNGYNFIQTFSQNNIASGNKIPVVNRTFSSNFTYKLQQQQQQQQLQLMSSSNQSLPIKQQQTLISNNNNATSYNNLEIVSQKSIIQKSETNLSRPKTNINNAESSGGAVSKKQLLISKQNL